MAKEKWTRVENVAEFLRQGRTVRGVHAFTRKILHWPYCQHCGLMLLKNDRTRKAVKAACVQLED